MHAETPKCVQVWTAATPMMGCPVASGASFGRNNAANFHRVFTSHISVLQGECAAVVQTLKDTPGDVPLLISCTSAELHMDIQARVKQSKLTKWYERVRDIWPLLE